MTLTQILQKIKSVFYTKAEVDTSLSAKANDSDVVHTSGNETIGGTKTFSDNIKLADTGSVILGDSIRIQGGSDWDNGGRITVNPKTINESIILQAFNNEGNSAYIFANGSVYHFMGGTDNLGTSTNKWADVNTTLLNGKTPAYDSDVVHKSGNETISGVKTFSDTPIVTSSRTYTSQIKADRINGTKTDFSANNGFKIVCDRDTDAWNNTAFAIHLPTYSPQTYTVAFKMFDCVENSSTYKGFLFKKADDNFQFSPTHSNLVDLGTSTNKWKTLNGINIGALSLPNISTGINLDLTNFKLDGSDNHFYLTSFGNYPYDNGWLFVKLHGCTSYYADHWYKVVASTFATPSTVSFFMPINNKYNDIVLRCVCTSIEYVKIFPCQGNV